MPVSFTAIDFETANSHPSSACAVGLVKVVDGRVVDRAAWLIRPPAEHGAFLEWNVRIHGIEEADVADARDWAAQFGELVDFVDGDVLVAHNAGFDMGVIRAACAISGDELPDVGYQCSVQVARRTYRLDSYKLPLAAAAAGFSAFRHHDALADAEACAAIMVDACRVHGVADLYALEQSTGARIRRLDLGARLAAAS